MTDERASALSEALARGRKAADQLGSATDQLTETIARIERALEDLRFGVPASIEILSEHYADDGIEFEELAHLAFRKEGKRWALFIDSATSPCSEEEWTSTPLVNASRELRLLAVEKMPTLIDAMVEASEKRLAAVSEGQKRADALLAALTAQASQKGPLKFVAPKIGDATVVSVTVKKP